MKQKNGPLFCIAVGCLVVTLCAIGSGQDQPHRGKFSVPFEFDVGGTKLPAGEYVLEAVSSSYGTLRSTDGKTEQTMYFVQTGVPEKNPRVIFAVRNGKYFFSGVSVWIGKLQYTGFHPHEGDETKDVPITPVE